VHRNKNTRMKQMGLLLFFTDINVSTLILIANIVSVCGDKKSHYFCEITNVDPQYQATILIPIT
jgi:hypothetical protein